MKPWYKALGLICQVQTFFLRICQLENEKNYKDLELDVGEGMDMNLVELVMNLGGMGPEKGIGQEESFVEWKRITLEFIHNW